MYYPQTHLPSCFCPFPALFALCRGGSRERRWVFFSFFFALSPAFASPSVSSGRCGASTVLQQQVAGRVAKCQPRQGRPQRGPFNATLRDPPLERPTPCQPLPLPPLISLLHVYLGTLQPIAEFTPRLLSSVVSRHSTVPRFVIFCSSLRERLISSLISNFLSPLFFFFAYSTKV